MKENLNFTILIVDDEDSNIYFLNKTLKNKYTIKVAHDGYTALKILEKFDINLILLDIVMPKLDGYETLKKIKENPKTQNIPVIFLTMKNDSDSITKAFELGAKDYIKKPFNINELQARIDNQLQNQTLNLKLKKEKEKFQILLKNSGDGVFILNMQGKLILASDSLCNLLGYAQKELLMFSLKDFEINLKTKQSTFTIEELKSRALSFETNFKTKHDEYLNILLVTRPVKFDNKYYIYCSAKDITKFMKQDEELSEHKAELVAQNEELREKEKELIKVNEEHEVLFEEAPISYYVIDKEFKIVKQNLTSLRKFKKPVTNIFGTILNTDCLYKTMLYLDKCNILDEGITVEIKDKFNQFKHVKLSACKYPMDETKYLVALTDTETDFILLKEQEKNYILDKQLIEQSKLAQMGEMIGNIAHQWRQPLSVISVAATGSLCKIEYDDIDKDELSKNLKLINKESQYLSETIDVFRNFLLEEKIVQRVIIQDRIQTAIDIVSINLKNNNIELKTNLNEIEPIEYDLVLGELTQVIINLINNSKDALKDSQVKNKFVSINLKKTKQHILLEIEDNGGGIKEDIIDKIFEPYFSTKGKAQGTGLGLYMSYQIINNSLNGKIQVENTKDGAKFTIFLPKK